MHECFLGSLLNADCFPVLLDRLCLAMRIAYSGFFFLFCLDTKKKEKKSRTTRNPAGRSSTSAAASGRMVIWHWFVV